VRNDGRHEGGGAGTVAPTKEGKKKTFRRALAWRKLVFRLVELVNQSKEKGCEDLVSSAMMCIGEMAGCVVLPQFSLLTGKYLEGLC
jgi:hypothetical protein